MKPQKTTAAKTVKNKTKPAESEVAVTAGFSLEPVYTALRKRYPPRPHRPKRWPSPQTSTSAWNRNEFPHHSAEEWAALAAETLEFARARKPARPTSACSIRLRRPTVVESPHTVLQIVNDDMPFLRYRHHVAGRAGAGCPRAGHPVLHFTPRQGRQAGQGREGDAESVMLLEIDRQRPTPWLPSNRPSTRPGRSACDRARLAADEGQGAGAGRRPRQPPAAGRRRIAQGAQEFLRWAADNHFTFIGYREYRVEKQGKEEVLAPLNDTGLGLMRGKDKSGRPSGQDPGRAGPEHHVRSEMR